MPKKEEKVRQNFAQPIETENVKTGVALTATENEKGKTRDKVAKDVGFCSGRQYEKAKKVYETDFKDKKTGKFTTGAKFCTSGEREESDEGSWGMWII